VTRRRQPGSGRRSTEQLLAELHGQTRDPASAPARAALSGALAGANFAVVAAAAQIIEREQLAGFADDLEDALHRFLSAGAESDKGCQAMAACADALYRSGAGSFPLWVRASRHVQMEAVWGKRIDTAGVLRGIAALALAESGSPEALFELTRLLADPLPEARKHAARALGTTRRTDAELLLRLRLLAGDPQVEVLGECLSGLMRANPERSLDFVADYLDHPQPALREGAAIGLGESHLPEALALLTDAWSAEPRADARAALVLGIALHRTEPAFEFLLSAACDAQEPLRIKILHALETCAPDERHRARVSAVAAGRKS
jgi:HEAT repeat protein